MEFTKLDELVEEGYLRKVEDGDLVLYNYTDKCTFERKWTKLTLKSRGTVYRKSTGEVVAKAFPKFFNFGELAPAKQKTILNGSGVYGKYTVAEKMDGSLGIVYHDGEKWRVNTRGSFSSDQAIKATEMLDNYDIEMLDKDFTYLVEIIYPENKIIVNYGDEEKLSFLGAYETGSGEEYSVKHPFEIGEEYDLTIDEMIELQKTIPKDEEGFVVRFSNGERVKFKGAEYLKIARILKGCGPLALWEKMENGKVCQKFVESIPEEIYPEIKPIIEKLENKYHEIRWEIAKEYSKMMTELNIKFPVFNHLDEDRKRIGLFLKDNKLEHSGAIFSWYLGKTEAIEKYIMKEIRPKANVL